jgi:hypothetical protein
MKEYVKLPTQEYLKECFDYNPETGKLYWKERPLQHFSKISQYKGTNKRLCGKEINSKMKFGYLQVKLDSVNYRLHRIIWKWYYGEDPIDLIDHVNGIRDDNRICNLREATHFENNRNLSVLQKNNTSGYTGVSLSKEIARKNKWIAYIMVDGKVKNLGSYATKEEAISVRRKAAIEYYGEFYADIDEKH